MRVTGIVEAVMVQGRVGGISEVMLVGMGERIGGTEGRGGKGCGAGRKIVSGSLKDGRLTGRGIVRNHDG